MYINDLNYAKPKMNIKSFIESGPQTRRAPEGKGRVESKASRSSGRCRWSLVESQRGRSRVGRFKVEFESRS